MFKIEVHHLLYPASEWQARRTRDIETRKDLLAEAYILKMENL